MFFIRVGLFLCGVLLIIATRVKSPELTETQLFIEYWLHYLAGLGFLIASIKLDDFDGRNDRY